MSKKATIYSAIKWLFVIAAFLYLAYKLISFDKYGEFVQQWHNTPLRRYWWLVAVFVLLPLNWCLESIKWQRLTAHVQKLTFSESLKSVLAGITTGFFTPNRIGEMVGRIMFLREGNRSAGITLSLLNGFTQNLIIILCGVPACVMLLLSEKHLNSNIMLYLGLCLAVLILFGLFYFFLPILSKKISATRWGDKINGFIACLSGYSKTDLIRILGVSMLRYTVFSIQFFFMLRFFDVQLTPAQALLAIPANYLFVTFTPSLAFSEAAVRTSYAMMFIGMFSEQTINIALAGVAIWFVNWVIPLITGSVIVLRTKSD